MASEIQRHVDFLRSESYSLGVELDAVQLKFSEMRGRFMNRVRHVNSVPYAGLGFLVPEFGTNQRFALSHRVAGMTIASTPAAGWRNYQSNRFVKFNGEEAHLRAGPAGLCLGGNEDGSPRPFMFDAGTGPRRDHPTLQLRELPEGSPFLAPASGRVSVRSNAVWRDVRLGDRLLVRLAVVDGVDLSVEDGEVVAAGTPLFQAPMAGRPLVVAVATGVMTRIHGAILPMSQRPWSCRLAVELLGRMFSAAFLPPQHQDRPKSAPLTALFPVVYAALPPAALRTMPIEELEPPAPLQEALLGAIAPGGDFCLRAPRSGMYNGRVSYTAGSFDGVLIGDQEIPIPRCAVLDPSLSVGMTVDAGRKIGDFTERLHQSWGDFASAAGVNAQWVVREFLQAHAIQPGQQTWEDTRYVLVRAEFLSPAALSQCRMYALDFAPLEQWRVTTYGTYPANTGCFALPPLRVSRWDDLLFTANGLTVNWFPWSERFESSGLASLATV